MTIQLTAAALRGIFPKAPQAVLDAFLTKQAVLDAAGVSHTHNRLAYALAQVEHETSGFVHMRENINYTPERAAQVWPFFSNRAARSFRSADDCLAKVGSFRGDPDFPNKLMDVVYGGRMGNRPGTHDGSSYIGRGGPQVTGLDGYKHVAALSGVPIDANPTLAEAPSVQPEIMCGFVRWKNLNAKADLGDFTGYVRVWNGGTNGLADRQHILAGNDPLIARLETINEIKPQVDELPGKPPTPEPPHDVKDEATKNERAARKVIGAGGAAGAGGNEATDRSTPSAGTVQPDVPVTSSWMPSPMTVVIAGIAVAAIVVATVLISRKIATLKANWN